MTRQGTCAERIGGQWASLAEDLALLFKAQDVRDLDDLTAEERESFQGEYLKVDGDADDLAVNTAKYEAVPVLEYLEGLNKA